MSENPRQAQAPTNIPTNEVPNFNDFPEGSFGITHADTPTNPDHITNFYDSVTMADAAEQGILHPQEAKQIDDYVTQHVAGAAAINEGIVGAQRPTDSETPIDQRPLPTWVLPEKGTLDSRLSTDTKKVVGKVAIGYAVVSGVTVATIAGVGGYGVVKGVQTMNEYKDLGSNIAAEANSTDPLTVDENGNASIPLSEIASPTTLESESSREDILKFAIPIFDENRNSSAIAVKGKPYDKIKHSNEIVSQMQKIFTDFTINLYTAREVAKEDPEKGQKLYQALVDPFATPEAKKFYDQLVTGTDEHYDTGGSVNDWTSYTSGNFQGVEAIEGKTTHVLSRVSGGNTDAQYVFQNEGSDDKPFYVVKYATDELDPEFVPELKSLQIN